MASPPTTGVARKLTVDQLRRTCDPASFTFETTAELTPITGLIGQDRAAAALSFGIGIQEKDFNIFAAGAPGTGKRTAVGAFLETIARDQPAPPDWCYIHNFDDPARPKALRMPPGQARLLRDGLRNLVRAARREIPRAFESEEYIQRRERIVSGLQRTREGELGRLGARAQVLGFGLQVTPAGIAIIPMSGNQPMTDEQIAGLRPEMREELQRRREALEEEVRQALKTLRIAERETRDQLDAQDREVALHAVGGLVEDLADDFPGHDEISAFLDDIREGILADIALFRGNPLPADGVVDAPQPAATPEQALQLREFRKYDVNIVVDHHGNPGAPVVFEVNPTYPNLVGRIEREALLGALVTDFTLLTGGALHRANGGYLMLRAEDMLRSPMAWDGLKRALRAGQVAIEDPTEAIGLTTTRGLQPDPIPLDVKVVLLGELSTYALMFNADPDFRELFKVRADFAGDVLRVHENERALVSVAAACTQDGLPVDRTGMARLVEEASRMVDDQRKLSARPGPLQDLVREAGYWARADGATTIGAVHVRRAVEQRRYRTSLLPDRMNEMVERGIIVIRPEGTAVGQIHGLAVLGFGDTMFGRPSRITATIGAGRDGVLDIERQVELGGRIHSKGMLILGGYLNDRYAQDKPLAMSARLVFEQSYEGIDGDSASMAELVVLLSRLADVPLRQDIAMTGSVNQRGESQAVGGVNEKIEGFYDACVAAGLTGTQGVIIPAANVEHLMLRDDVVEAAAAGRFHVWSITSVDEALAHLSGLAPEQIHQKVNAGIQRFANALREFGSPGSAAPPALIPPSTDGKVPDPGPRAAPSDPSIRLI